MFEDDLWYFPTARQRRYVIPSRKRSTGVVAKNKGPKDHIKEFILQVLLTLKRLPVTLMYTGDFVLDGCVDLMIFLFSGLDYRTMEFLISAFFLSTYMMLIYLLPVPFALLSILYFLAISLMRLVTIIFDNLRFYVGLLVDLLIAVASRNPKLAHALIGLIIGLNVVILSFLSIPSLENHFVNAIGIIAIIASPKQQLPPQRGTEDA